MLTADQAKSYLKRLLFMDSPLHGLLLMFSLGLMWVPVAYCICFCKLCGDSFQTRCVNAIVFFAVVAFAMFVLVAAALFSMGSWRKRSKAFRIILCLVEAVFVNISGYCLLAVHYFRKRLWPSLVLLFGSFSLVVLKTISMFAMIKWVVHYDIELRFCVYLLAAASVFLATGLKPFMRTAVAITPAIVAVVAVFLLHLHFSNTRQANAFSRQEISQLLGRSIEREAFKERFESGSHLDEELLASFAEANAFRKEMNIVDYQTLSPEAKTAFLQEYIASAPYYPDTVHRFASQKITKVARSLDWGNEYLWGVPMPDLARFRDSGKFLAMEIMAHPQDKELVRRNNSEMVALREVPLHGSTLIERLVAVAVENMRIRALCNTLGQNRYTQDEWEELLGPPVDWSRHFAYAMGDEACFFQDTLLYLFDHAGAFGELFGTERFPPFLSVGFLRMLFEDDYSFALHYFQKTIEFLLGDKHDYSAIDQTADAALSGIRQQGAFLSAALLPALAQVIRKADMTKDARRLAALAWQVVEYKHRNGRFPEALTEVSNDLLDSIHQKPFALETGTLKVKLEKGEAEVDGFRIYAWHDKAQNDMGKSAPCKVLVPLE